MTAENLSEDFHSELIGLDIVGFTAFFERQLERHGKQCLEALTGRINTGFEAAHSCLSRHGFEIGVILGDCIIFFRKCTSPPARRRPAALDRYVNDALEAFIAGSEIFAARAASSCGRTQLHEIKGPDDCAYRLLCGEAVEELHCILSSKGERVAVRPALKAATLEDYQPGAAAPELAAPELAVQEAGAAEQRDAVILFCRLCQGGQVQQVSPGVIRDAVRFLIHAAAAIGGIFEKITHDDKGLIAAIAFRDASLQGVMRADRFPLHVADGLRDIGLEPTFGIAMGRIYYGPMQIAGRFFKTMHGPAVNAAAKQLVRCSSMVCRDPSLQTALSAAEIEADARGANDAAPLAERHLVGRQLQLAMILADAEAASAGRSCATLVQAEAGGGKTHLCRHAADELSGRFSVVQTHCRPDRSIIPMGTALPLVSGALGRLSELEESEPITCIDNRITRHFASSADQLRGICNIHFGTDFPVHSDGELPSGEQRRQILIAFSLAVFRDLARHKPVAIVVDDLQWADAISVALIERMITEVPRMYGLFANRTSTTAGHADILLGLGKQKCRSIKLPGLSRGELAALVPEKLARLQAAGIKIPDLFGLTGGNPYYLIQLVNGLAENPDMEDLDLSGLRDPALRNQVMADIVMNRLDGLEDAETIIVRIAALVSDPMSFEDHHAIAARLGEGIADKNTFDALVDRAFLAPGNDGSSYQIAHGLMSEKIVERSTGKVIRNLCGHIARFATRRRLDDPASMSRVSIANHWRRAASNGRAAILLGAEAEAALDVGAYPDAIKLFHKAEALARLKPRSAPTSHRRASTWHAHTARARWGMGDINGARADAYEALHLADRWAFSHKKADKKPPQGSAGRYGAGWAIKLKTKRMKSQRLAVPVNLANAVRGELAYYTGDIGEIGRANAISFLLATNPALRSSVAARNYAMLGYSTGIARLSPASKLVYSVAERRLGKLKDKRPIAFVEASEAVVDLAFGRWADAERKLLKARQHASDPYDPHIFEIIGTLQALCAQFKGDWASARDMFAGLQVQARARGNHLHEAWGHYGQAQACLVGGAIEEAGALLAPAEPVVRQLGDKQSQLICLGLRAQIHLAKGDIEAALTSAEQALCFGRSVPPYNFSSLEGYAAPALVGARILDLPGLPPPINKRAYRLAKDAIPHLGKFARMFPIGRPRTMLCQALFCRCRHQHRRSRARIAKARRLAANLGMRYELELIDRVRLLYDEPVAARRRRPAD